MRDSGPDRLFSPWRCGYVVSHLGQQTAYFSDAGFYFSASGPCTIKLQFLRPRS